MVDLQELAIRGGHHRPSGAARKAPPPRRRSRPPRGPGSRTAGRARPRPGCARFPGDEEEAVPGVALAHDDSTRAHEVAGDTLRDAAEEECCRSAERARERLAPRPAGRSPRPRTGEPLPVEGQRVPPGRLRPRGVGLRAGGVRDGWSSPRSFGSRPRPRRFEPGPPREGLEAVPDVRAAGRHRVGPSQRLEGPFVEPYRASSSATPSRTGTACWPWSARTRRPARRSARGGRSAVRDFGAQDRHGLGVGPFATSSSTVSGRLERESQRGPWSRLADCPTKAVPQSPSKAPAFAPPARPGVLGSDLPESPLDWGIPEGRQCSRAYFVSSSSFDSACSGSVTMQPSTGQPPRNGACRRRPRTRCTCRGRRRRSTLPR